MSQSQPKRAARIVLMSMQYVYWLAGIALVAGALWWAVHPAAGLASAGALLWVESMWSREIQTRVKGAKR